MTDAVGSLGIDDVTATEFHVHWDAPSTSCELSYYVEYEWSAKWGDDPVSLSGSDEKETKSTEIKLTDLLPYSDYQVCVTAVTGAGASSEACYDQQTQQDGKWQF